MTALNEFWPDWWSALGAAGLGLERSETLEAQFAKLYEDLLTYNQKVNLTRITEPRDFLYRHLLDCLTPLPWIPPEASVVDVGSGAGFPAIPLALARPDLKVTAVESIGKKCAFIQQVSDDFGLGERLKVENRRSEDLGRLPEFRERFDIVIARAVAALPTLLELCLPLGKPRSRFLAMKGTSYEAELEASRVALQNLRGKLAKTQRFDAPELSGSVLLVFEKTGSTPKDYPRAAGAIKKKPL